MVIAVFWLWGCFDHQVDMIRKQLGHSSRKGLKGATRGSISSTLYTGRDVTKVSGSINPFLRCLLYWYSGEIACDLFAFDYLMHTENSGEETNSSFDTDGQTLTDSFQSVQRVVFQTGGEWLFQPISKIPYIIIYTLYCQLAFVPLLWMESRDSLKLPGNWPWTGQVWHPWVLAEPWIFLLLLLGLWLNLLRLPLGWPQAGNGPGKSEAILYKPASPTTGRLDGHRSIISCLQKSTPDHSTIESTLRECIYLKNNPRKH